MKTSLKRARKYEAENNNSYLKDRQNIRSAFSSNKNINCYSIVIIC